jgi:hypothetical protein
MIRSRRQLVLLGITVLSISLLLHAQTSPKKPAQKNTPTSGTLVLTFGAAVNNPEGQAAAAKLLQALGGTDHVDAVKTLRQKIIMLKQGQKIESEQTIVYPDKQAQEIKLPQGPVLRVVTPTEAFAVTGSQVSDLPAAEAASSRAALKHDFLNVMQHIHDPKYAFEANGQERIDDVDATIVAVNADGTPTRWWIAADGRLLQECFTDLGQAVPTTLTFKYSDWKKFGGLNYPTRYAMEDESGRTVLTMSLVGMQVNATVDQKLFERPSK